MPLLRKTVALLLTAAALFFAGGIALAPPAYVGATLVLALITATMLTSAFLVWPRTTRPWRIDAMLSGH